MSPNPGPWNEPVLIQLPDAQNAEIVANAREAHEILSRRWPAHSTGASYTSALAACSQVLSGNAPAYLSRIAFVNAVEEAGFKQ
ncbi:hypothetical protein LPJGGPFB_05131 [Ensifer adhaerens]|uniref:DUF982 domain-containing protein n=1 Tax=Ensifer adhaerens TaxID=106592 RepID=UPI0015683A13|nr:DUF982 domain-containing protein [Ensifer adhaerens]NRP21872.1 hypothetical protein [Ensifer adhaerens]